MQFAIGFGIVLLSTLVLARDRPLIGGHRPVSSEDKENVEAAKTLVKAALEKQYPKDMNYNPQVTLEEIEVKKQLVNGLLYHLKLRATTNFECNKASNGCIKKEPVVKVCTAKVHKPFAPSAPVAFASGVNAPTCA